MKKTRSKKSRDTVPLNAKFPLKLQYIVSNVTDLAEKISDPCIKKDLSILYHFQQNSILFNSTFTQQQWSCLPTATVMVKYGVGSPKFIWAAVLIGLRPRNSPTPPAFVLIYESAIGQPR